MTTCKGRKKDGTPCRSSIVLDNGYCRFHQAQDETEALDVSGPWTRERLEAAIAAHGGPEGLDLAGADLSNLYLGEMDLHGISLEPPPEANLQGAYLTNANLQGANLYGVNLQGASVEEANLQGANLNRVNLQGANLSSADLQGADVQAAKLQEADLGLANLQEANLYSTNLQGASLYGANLQGATLEFANLQGATLAFANLQGANLILANLQGAMLVEADLQKTNLWGADLREVDLWYVKPGGLREIKLYRAKLDHTALKREDLGSAIGDEQAGEYRGARDAYLALKQNFEGFGDYEAASWSYVKERQMEKACSAPWRARRLYGEEQLGDTSEQKLPVYHPRVWWFFVRHTRKWLSDWLVELICGYGERPWRTVATMAVVFAVFIGIYWATWAVMRVEETPQAIVRVPTHNLVDLLVFGLGAFTTMDPKGLEPRATWVQLVAGFEALLGIGLTGLLGFVLGNRIRRS
jgi:uncharacterized protein YjbI with pentapeptide repeats